MYLKDIADIGMGASTHGRSAVGSGDEFMPYINIKDIRDGYIAWNELSDVPILGKRQVERYTTKGNDIIVTIRGTQFRSALCANDNKPAIIASNLAYIRLKQDAPISAEALSAWLGSKEGQHEVSLLQRGTGLLSISIKDLGNLKIIIPEEDTQEKLIELVNIRSALKRLDEQIMTKRELILEATVKNLFSGKIAYKKETKL